MDRTVSKGENQFLAGTIEVNGAKFVPFITESVIQSRILELGEQLTQEYKGKNPIFVGVLNGAFLFMADLIRRFEGLCETDFVKISSYGNEMESSGKVELLKDLSASINGRHIIIVEDIIDTGISLKFLLEHMGKQKPASMSIVSLLLKPNSLKYDLKIDYIGFSIESKYVIGYGLDVAQQYRNVRSIYILDESN